MYLLKEIDEVKPFYRGFYCGLVSHDHVIPTHEEAVEISEKFRYPICRIIGLLRIYNIDYETMANSRLSDYNTDTGVYLGRYKFAGKQKSIMDKWIRRCEALGRTGEEFLLYKKYKDQRFYRQATATELADLARDCYNLQQKHYQKFYNRKRIAERGQLLYYSRKRYR